VNAVQELEDPPQGWRRGRLVDVVRHRLMMLGSWLAQSALRHGVDQQREGHHHQQSFHPAGLFDKQRRDKKQWVFEQPKAPFNPDPQEGSCDRTPFEPEERKKDRLWQLSVHCPHVFGRHERLAALV
jgi:hypothetical protein